METGAKIPREKGRILVLDDDPIVRDLMARQLEFLGYQAVAVGTRDKAKQHLFPGEVAGSNGRFDLLISDLMLTNRYAPDGTEFLAELKGKGHYLFRDYPDKPRAIIATGSCVDEANNWCNHNNVPILMKPYPISWLKATIDDRLDR